jgi:hypothetical protein
VFAPIADFIRFIFIEREVLQFRFFCSATIKSALGFHSLLTLTAESVSSFCSNVDKFYLYFIGSVRAYSASSPNLPGSTGRQKHWALSPELLNDYGRL